MSMGDGRNNSGGKNKLYENTYYSRVGFRDYDNGLKLGFQFKSGMLVIDIAKEKEGFEYETVANIFITPTKAKLLLEQIKMYKEDVKNGTMNPSIGYGINAGMGETVSVLILTVTPEGKKCIVVGKVNNDGKYTSKTMHVFNTNFHYGLKWNNIESMDCEKIYDDDVEFNQFVDMIQQFAISSNGAVAYSVVDIARYDYRALMNKMNPIYDKLGIERANSNSGNKSGNNYFNSSRGNNSGAASGSQHKSYEDMSEDLPFEED